MTYTIVGCGESARNWVQRGYSIGVNDCWKFGKPTNALVVCNRPDEFPRDRFNIITNSTPDVFYAHKANWAQFFPAWKKIRIHPWAGVLRDWAKSDGPHGYSLNTSPFIAATLAYHYGAKEIILWGVDFRTHHKFNDKDPNTQREVWQYLDLFNIMKERGVMVYRGADGSVFDESIPLYDTQEVQ